MVSFIPSLWNDQQGLAFLRNTGPSAASMKLWRGNIYKLAFEAGRLTEMFFNIQFDHYLQEGSNVRPHIHLSHKSAVNNGAFVVSLEYAWANNNEVYPTDNIIATDPFNVLGTDQYWLRPLSFPTIVGTGKKVSSIISGRLYRNAGVGGDTSTADLFLEGWDIHYQQDKPGSAAEFSRP